MSTPKPRRNRGGRPPLPAGLARVVLPPQRVRPDTLAWLDAHPGGLGRAIDHAVTCAKMVERQFISAGILDPRKK